MDARNFIDFRSRALGLAAEATIRCSSWKPTPPPGPHDREGAFLKPIAGWHRVDLANVDRMTFVLPRKAPGSVRWCMTEFVAAPGEVEKMSAPVLAKGKLLDEFGQSAQRQWPGKTRNETELKTRIREQYDSAAKQNWPAAFTRWGGWKDKKLGEATGFFRTHNDGSRWWLVDPDGYAFWSSGLDCVRVDADARVDGLESALSWIADPKHYAGAYPREGEAVGPRAGKMINHLAANMIRTFGPDGWRDKWSATALGEMKCQRFNTVGNWSEYQFAAKVRFPYVRPMNFRGRRSGMVYRDFPDIYHPGFEQDTTDYARPTKGHRERPGLPRLLPHE